MSVEILFYTQIGTIIAFIIALFTLYKVLVSQKDATIQLLQERLSSANEKIDALKDQTPDALAIALDQRITLMTRELSRMKSDEKVSRSEIAAKEAELGAFRGQLVKLTDLLQDSDLVCGNCSAPLIARHHGTITGYCGDKEIDADVEYREYECGASFKDHDQLTSCGTTDNT